MRFRVKRFRQISKQLCAIKRQLADCDRWTASMDSDPVVVPDDLPKELTSFLDPTRTLPLRGYDSEVPVDAIENARAAGATALAPLLLAAGLEHVRRQKVFYTCVQNDRSDKLSSLRSLLEEDIRAAYRDVDGQLLFDAPVDSRILQALRIFDAEVLLQAETDLLPPALAKGVREKNAKVLEEAKERARVGEDVHTLAAAVEPLIADQSSAAALQMAGRIEEALQPFLNDGSQLQLLTNDEKARLNAMESDSILSAADLDARAKQTRDLVEQSGKRQSKIDAAAKQAAQDTSTTTAPTRGAKGRKNGADRRNAARGGQGNQQKQQQQSKSNKQRKKSGKKSGKKGGAN